MSFFLTSFNSCDSLGSLSFMTLHHYITNASPVNKIDQHETNAGLVYTGIKYIKYIPRKTKITINIYSHQIQSHSTLIISDQICMTQQSLTHNIRSSMTNLQVNIFVIQDLVSCLRPRLRYSIGRLAPLTLH